MGKLEFRQMLEGNGFWYNPTDSGVGNWYLESREIRPNVGELAYLLGDAWLPCDVVGISGGNEPYSMAYIILPNGEEIKLNKIMGNSLGWV